MNAPVINMPSSMEGVFKEVYSDKVKDPKEPKYFKNLKRRLRERTKLKVKKP